MQLNSNIISSRLYNYLSHFSKLTKSTLSFTVVFSCVVSFLLVPENNFNLNRIILLFIAGYCITGSSNVINQILERNTDALMSRTSKRPIPNGDISVNSATIIAIILAIIGFLIFIIYFNSTSAFLSILGLVVYAFVYTPFKRINSIAVMIGAIPGALPCLIGWIAGYYDEKIFWIGGCVLFLIQFFWQFPHFWAIAWVSHKDYNKAGFKLLPSKEGPSSFTTLQGILYSIILVPVCFLPYQIGITGFLSIIILTICNIILIIQSIRLHLNPSIKAARVVMFSSYIYLPIVLLSLLADKNPKAINLLF